MVVRTCIGDSDCAQRLESSGIDGISLAAFSVFFKYNAFKSVILSHALSVSCI